MNFFKHLNNIRKHRKEVKRLCFKCGLYRLGMLHDLSKYSYIELAEGIRYFDGHKSPTSVCRKKNGKSKAWEHHIKKNKHHPEYWITKNNITIMPYKYAVESICDRIAASKIYNGEKYNAAMPLEYWTKQKQNNYSIGEEMSKFYDIVFSELAKHGENRILKREYLQEQYKICYEEYQIKN